MISADYFIFAVAFIWVLFASIQDLKTREVANWLSFSLIFIGLFYKLAYSALTNNYGYFLISLTSFVIFTLIAHIFYYGKVFAGGDSKLLMGIGALIPGNGINEVLINGLVFIFILLLLGSIWGVFALFTPLVPITKKKFNLELKKFGKYYPYLFLSSSIIVIIIHFILPTLPALILSIISCFVLLGYPLLKAADKCMIISLPANRLTEGDWIMNNIHVGNKVIRKTVHGLSIEDIKLLKKYNKKIEIKTGIPFVPSFLFTLIFMVFFWKSGQLPFLSLLTRFVLAS